MESREILKEFAGKLAGLSAAAKAVAIAGAVSAYSGTGYAAEKVSVKAENRFITVVEPKKSDAASDTKKEADITAKAEEVVAPKISEEAVKTLSASKEQDIAKAADAKATKVVKANIAPKIQEKVEIYEPKKISESKPKYDTKYYRAPGTGVTSDRTSRSTGSRSARSYASPSTRYDYDTPTSASFIATSSDEAFDERASSGSSSVNSGRTGRSYGRNHGRMRTYSESSYGSGSRNTVSKDKTDDTEKGNMSTDSKGGVTATASSAKPAGAVSFSGFSDPVGGSSAPKIDARAERAVKMLDRIESGELKLVEAGKAERALRTQKKIDDKEKKLVDYNDEVAVLNDTKREELQRLQAELRDARARYVGLQRQIEPLRIQQGSFSMQAQPIVQDENNGIGAVQPVAAQEQNPAEPGQVDVLPDAAQAAEVAQAVPGNGIPPPPPPLPPLVQVGADGIPVPQRLPEPDFDALLAGAIAEIDKKIELENEKLRKKAEQEAKEESDIFEAVNGIVNAVNGSSKSEEYYAAAKRQLAFKAKFRMIASRVYKQAINNPEKFPAFCESCMKVLAAAGSTEITKKATEVYKAAVGELSTYLSLAVAHSAGIGGDNVENDPCDLLDKCFKKYDVKLSDVKNTAIDRFSEENYNKCRAVWGKLTSNAPGALADAVDGNQCTPLDRAIFSAVGRYERAEGWYTDEEVKSEVEKKRKDADEFSKSDLNEGTKGELMRLFEDLNKVFWIGKIPDDFINAQNRASASKKCKELENKIKKILGKTKVSQLIAFKQELKVKWDELSAKFEGKGSVLKDLKKEVKADSDDKFNDMFSGAEKNFEKNKKDYEKVKLYPFISKLRRAVMDGKRDGRLTLKFDEGDLALMQEKSSEVKKLFKTILEFSECTEWILDGEWLKTFLSDLPKGKVTSLTITGRKTGNVAEVTYDKLNCLSPLCCPKLKKLTFKNVGLTKRALETLKLGRDVELSFIDVEAPVHYKGEGALKRLIDEGVKIVGEASWIKEGVQPAAANPEQGNLPGVVRNGVVANDGLTGDQQNQEARSVLARLRVRQREIEQRQGVVRQENNRGLNLPQLRRVNPVNPANPQTNRVEDILIQVQDALRSTENREERNTVVLELCKEMWESDDCDSIDVDIPILSVLGANVEAIVAEAVRCANEREKPLALTGTFTDTDGTIEMDNRGKIVGSMSNLRSPLKIKFSSPNGYAQGDNTIGILETILRKRAETTGIKSVEVAEWGIPTKKVLEALGSLNLEEVILLSSTGLPQDNPYFGELQLGEGTEGALKYLFMHTKKVNLAGNKIPGGVLARLGNVIKSMKPVNNGNDAGNPQANAPKPALEELVLPEPQDDREVIMIDEIQRFVRELKGEG